jgi:hypothetical protein
MSAVSVPRDVLVHRLYPDFEACAAITKHLTEVRLEAIIWPSLYCDANGLGFALFRISIHA